MKAVEAVKVKFYCFWVLYTQLYTIQLVNLTSSYLAKACKRKIKDTAEACRREGIVFLPFALETLGGLHPGAISQVKQVAAALARCKGTEEGEATSQLFGRISLTLMRANAMMLSTRQQDADFPLPEIDGVE